MKTRSWLGLIIAGLCASGGASATPWAISDVPLFVSAIVPPLNMLVLGRDHRLYYEAYNDASDLNGDGQYDVRYSPTTITYYGLFDSYRCYTYDTGNGRYNPTSNTANKKCAGASEWSGDFLNYLTTSRMDAIRKVLYGGKRFVDTATDTVLERAYIPQDAHSWGKEYTSTAVDGFDIAEYSSLGQPSSGRRHLFASTSLLSDTATPLLRIIENQGQVDGQDVRIWNWVSIERPVAGGKFFHGGSGPNITSTITDRKVRVKVCVLLDGKREDNCKLYNNGTSYKPIGLLQDYGTGNRMLFGLITGSNNNNLQGGVLRKKIGDINSEINQTDGTIKTADADEGIILTLDRLRVVGFGSGHQYDCAWSYSTSTLQNGNCKSWGNPLGEIMYEGMRYFSGAASATSSYLSGVADDSDGGLDLPLATWDNPYDMTNRTDGRAWCSKPFMTAISDSNPTFDSEVPGSAFGSTVSNTLGSFNAKNWADKLWDEEYGGGTTKSVFVGEINGGSAAETDKNPTPKTVGSSGKSLGSVRGLSPEDPTLQGTYYSAAVAAWGRTNDVNTTAQGAQNVQTFAVALASPLPRIVVPAGNGKQITILPFAKSVAGNSISETQGNFQPTNQIVDFYVESIINDGNAANVSTANGGRYQAVFRINFEDLENGGDHDMDAIAKYTVTANADNSVSVAVDSIYAAGGIAQHMGFVVSGSTSDGTYLVVRDCDTAHSSMGSAANDVCSVTGNNPGTDPIYYLDKPTRASGSLPLRYSGTFTAGSNPTGQFIPPPLWFAAKYGGFQDLTDNPPISTPRTKPSSWNEDTTEDPAVPDNYFLVVNPLKLRDQLTKAFDDILRRTTSASAVATSSTSVRTDSQVFIAQFSSDDWSGSLAAQRLETDGSLGAGLWNAATLLQTTGDSSGRKFFTMKRGTAVVPTGISLAWGDLGDTQRAALNIDSISGNSDTLGSSRLDFVKGDRSLEGTTFRKRGTSVLGDIVFSSPKYVGPPRELYSDTGYANFKTTQAGRTKAVYVGANDGMLHAFDATLSSGGTAIAGTSGKELFAYVPSPVIANLNRLSAKNYNSAASHRYFVDGSPTVEDAYVSGAWKTVLVGGLNKGGKGIYALDVTTPSTFSTANVMWEFTDADDADLGFTFSRPKIVKLNDGKWYALFGNGYNSTNEKSVLFIVDLAGPATGGVWTAGTQYRKLVAGAAGGAGLSGITPVDIDVDGKVDYVYAGDIQGKMWKFDLTSTTPASWTVGLSGVPLFVAKDTASKPQPIMAEPKVSLHPVFSNQTRVSSQATPVTGAKLRGSMVYFGTGAYLEPCETTSTCSTRATTNSFYGIWDDDVAITGTAAATLLNQTYATLSSRTLNDLPITWKVNNSTSSHMGWYVNLDTTERAMNTPFVTAENVLFNTIIPSSSPCVFGGTGWLMCMNYINGGICRDVTPASMTAAYGGLSLVDSYGVGNSKLQRIDQGLLTNQSKTHVLYSDASGASNSQTLNLSKKIRSVNWRELINE